MIPEAGMLARSRQRHDRLAGGFTLIDLLVTMTIIAVMAAVLLPRMNTNGRLRLMAGSRILASDIEMAQIMTISNPAKPIVVKFDPAQSTYWLATSADPDTPIHRPGAAQPYKVVFGSGRGRTAKDVTFALTDLDENTLTFNEQGGILDPTTEPQIKLMQGSRWITLSVSTMTGSISETSGG